LGQAAAREERPINVRACKTVFIIGAGASEEVGIPFGRAFLESISDRLNFQIAQGSLVPGLGDEDILDAVQQYARDRASINGYLAAARRIREGIPFSRSIDSFMDAHRDDDKIQLLGKLAIAKTVLEHEQRSCLYISGSPAEFNDRKKLNGSWFACLSQGLNDGVRREAIKRLFERVSFIVFNYDRCLEHFLHSSMQRHYGIDDGEARAVLETATILHPYGTIAKLPWQDGASGLPFGFPTNRPNLLMMVKQIKTFTEQVENSDTLAAIKSEFAGAETLVCLGFSYHDLNMKILDPDRECAARNVFGTSFGISEDDVSHIKDQIRGLIRRNLTENRMRGGTETIVERLHIRSDLKCGALLNEYSRSLFVPGHGSRS
jgi:hypothetical protein